MYCLLPLSITANKVTVRAPRGYLRRYCERESTDLCFWSTVFDVLRCNSLSTDRDDGQADGIENDWDTPWLLFQM